nr:hypothetical protein Iba_chr04bCG14910 [Ipomoea batatas]
MKNPTRLRRCKPSESRSSPGEPQPLKHARQTAAAKHSRRARRRAAAAEPPHRCSPEPAADQPSRRTAAATEENGLLRQRRSSTTTRVRRSLLENRGRRSPFAADCSRPSSLRTHRRCRRQGRRSRAWVTVQSAPVSCCREGSASCCYATRFFAGIHRRSRTLVDTTIAALLVVTPTREEDRGRRLLLRSASCYDVRVADDRGMLLHCFAQRRRGASASDAIGYATAIAHWIAMLCFANIGAVRRRRSRELRSPALEVTVGSPPL